MHVHKISTHTSSGNSGNSGILYFNIQTNYSPSQACSLAWRAIKWRCDHPSMTSSAWHAICPGQRCMHWLFGALCNTAPRLVNFALSRADRAQDSCFLCVWFPCTSVGDDARRACQPDDGHSSRRQCVQMRLLMWLSGCSWLWHCLYVLRPLEYMFELQAQGCRCFREDVAWCSA